MNKCNLQNKSCTLDKKHAEMVEKFKNNEKKIIPKLLNEIEKNQLIINKLNNNNNNNKNFDKIKTLENNINNLKKKN